MGGVRPIWEWYGEVALGRFISLRVCSPVMGAMWASINASQVNSKKVVVKIVSSY